MQAFVLLGYVEHEGSDVLGVYADLDSARRALAAFQASDGDYNQYDGYSLDAREVGAPARYSSVYDRLEV